MNMIEVLVPTASTRTPKLPLAERLGETSTARIALLDNMKANAPELLHELAETLHASGHQFERVRLSKNATAAAPEVVMAHLKTCDAVVLAIAD